MSISHHHNEWLNPNLVPSSGPFVSLPVVVQAFPQGLDKVPADEVRQLRIAYEEWRDSQKARPDAVAHRRWIRYVLADVLGYGPALREGQDIPEPLRTYVAEQGETLRPDFLVAAPGGEGPARVLVQLYPKAVELDRPLPAARWKASPETRMAQLLHDTGVRLGLCTNGEHFLLVHAQRNQPTGFASFYAELWQEESLTLRAFRSLLGATRLFGVAQRDTLEGLYDRSAEDEHEVTDQLGYQVRRAVEVLIQALDKADQDHGRRLLATVDARVLYEAALTVMMRLVFLFCAEERELLLLGDDLYDRAYAISTLRDQLRADADQHGEEILGLRYDAWARLLATFRAVYAGVQHERVKLPAYGGELFSPDRFPFLEGREAGTSWLQTPATPLPVSSRTVLHLLESLQVLQVRLPGGGATEARRLSFRALDIEQIGHVYEGLLDHTAVRATEPVVGLLGTRDKEPEIALSELERQRRRGAAEFVAYLKEQTGRSDSALQKALRLGEGGGAALDPQLTSRLRTACGTDDALLKRVLPLAGLLRLDTYGYPVVIAAGSVYVTAGTDRRSSGTHYTPKSLTEPIVEHTLAPLCFLGPAEGLSRAEWRLRRAQELLDLKVCDLACGSGAFLVQACRYLAAQLQQAWEDAKRQHPGAVHITPFGEPSSGRPGELLLPEDACERETFALRLVAQRCLYGVDKNPLAVEMAKLSLWLLTLAKDKPFEFLDHALRSGDSLVGIRSLAQLRTFSLDEAGAKMELFTYALDDQIRAAAQARQQLESAPANSIDEVQVQADLLKRCDEQLARLSTCADWLIAADLAGTTASERQDLRDRAVIEATNLMLEGDLHKSRAAVAALLGKVKPLHWPLEFPEVVVERGGFDAFVGNPPFMGGRKIRGALGERYLWWLTESLCEGASGNADLCAFFFLRIHTLVSPQGGYGLIATNTIAQGDTREVGLERLLLAGAQIYRAVPSLKWPGTANLEVSQVWARRSAYQGEAILNDKPSPEITAFLTARGEAAGKPYRLLANEGKSYIGSYVLGMGFVLTPEVAQALIAKDPRNKEVLYPYLNGEDLNARPDQSPSRWVINFHDWPEERARTYVDCWKIIEEKVRPERQRKNERGEFVLRKPLPQRYWHYADKRPELYATIQGLGQVLARARVSNTNSIAFVSKRIVCSEQVVVFALDDLASLSILQSTINNEWIVSYASSLRADVRYTPSDCFDNLPFPTSLSALDPIGKRYHDHRRDIMLTRQQGLTKTYNRFHNPEETSSDIQKLRQLHVEMDHAVAAAYGWTDLDLGHGFHAAKQGARYTLSEPARREVLARLLRLNHERYEDEVRRGLHDKAKKKTRAEKGAAVFTTLEGSDSVQGEKVLPAESNARKSGGTSKKKKSEPSGSGQGSLFE